MTTAPQPKLRVSRQGLELVKSFEGLRRRAARLPNGRFVVGYGHIRSAREGAEIGPEDAEALLRYDLLPVEAAINEWALAPLTQNQFDALVSFAFNIGLSSFRRSDVLRRINEGDMLRAAAGMDTWRRVDLEGEPVIVDALVRRRAVEKALFLTPPQGQVPAPSAVLKPRIDTEAFSSVLLRRPEEIATPFEGEDATPFRAEPDFQSELEDEPEFASDESAPERPALSVTDAVLTFVPDIDGDGEPELAVVETTATLVPDLDGDGEPDLVVTETATVLVPDLDGDGEPDLVVAETTVVLASGDAADAEDEASDIDAADGAPEFVAPFASDPTLEDADADLDDEDDQPEEELSAAQAAAAAVFARLSEILAQDRDEEEEGDLSSLTIDPQPETASGEFLQAPPAPPEMEPAGFPEMDEAGLASFDAETPDSSDMDFAPEADADLQPFPEDGALPPVIEPEEQAEFNSAFIDEDELDTGEPSVPALAGEHWDERSGAQPTQGDPAALARPLEENSRAGMLMFLALAGLALVIGGLVSFARPGADEAGSGWTWLLGTAGVLLMAVAAYIAMAPKEESESGDDAPQA